MSKRGDTSVELLRILVVVVIPALYIVLAIDQVNVGATAIDVRAREAVYILAEDLDRTVDANRVVTLIIENFGMNATPEVVPTCKNCQDGEGAVDMRVFVQIPPLFTPAWLGGLGVSVSSSIRTPVWEMAARE